MFGIQIQHNQETNNPFTEVNRESTISFFNILETKVTHIPEISLKRYSQLPMHSGIDR